MSQSLDVQVLLRAAEICGGAEALGHYLQVPRAELMRWILGQATPTRKAFLDAVDLLLEHNMGRYGPQPQRSAPKP